LKYFKDRQTKTSSTAAGSGFLTPKTILTIETIAWQISKIMALPVNPTPQARIAPAARLPNANTALLNTLCDVVVPP